MNFSSLNFYSNVLLWIINKSQAVRNNTDDSMNVNATCFIKFISLLMHMSQWKIYELKLVFENIYNHLTNIYGYTKVLRFKNYNQIRGKLSYFRRAFPPLDDYLNQHAPHSHGGARVSKTTLLSDDYRLPPHPQAPLVVNQVVDIL